MVKTEESFLPVDNLCLLQNLPDQNFIKGVSIQGSWLSVIISVPTSQGRFFSIWEFSRIPISKSNKLLPGQLSLPRSLLHFSLPESSCVWLICACKRIFIILFLQFLDVDDGNIFSLFTQTDYHKLRKGHNL